MADTTATPQTMVRHVPGILVYLIHVDSLLAMSVLAIVLSVLEWVGSLPSELAPLANVAARLLWFTYFFFVARKAAMGKLRLPVPSDFRDPLDGLIRPLTAVIFATLWYWVVLAAHTLWTADTTELLQQYQAHPLMFLVQQGPAGYGLLGLALLYLPMGVVGALSGGPLSRHLNPLHALARVSRIPRAYAIAFSLLATLVLVGFIIDGLAARLEVLPIPLAGPVIQHLMGLWVPLAQARLLGGFVYHNQPLLEP